MNQSLQALRDIVNDPSQNFAAVGTAVAIVVIFVILIVLALIAAALPSHQRHEQKKPNKPEKSERKADPEHRGPFLAGRALPRVPRWISVLILLGILSAGLIGGTAFWYDSTSTNQYCTSTCHAMAEPTRTWASSSHANVECIRCHEGIKWETLSEGLNRRVRCLYFEVTGRRSVSRPVNEDTCLNCHGGLLDTPLRARNGETFTHGQYLRNGRACISCHGAQGHELPR